MFRKGENKTMETLKTLINDMFHKDCSSCTNEELYTALLTYTKQQLEAKGYHEGKKKIYYISAEFLIGKLLSNNLINLGIYDEVSDFLKENGKVLSEIEEVEPEPSLETAVSDVWQHAFWTPSQPLVFPERVLD